MDIKKNDNSTDATNFGDGRPLPDDSAIKPFVSLFSVLNLQTLGSTPWQKHLRGVVGPTNRK